MYGKTKQTIITNHLFRMGVERSKLRNKMLNDKESRENNRSYRVRDKNL